MLRATPSRQVPLGTPLRQLAPLLPQYRLHYAEGRGRPEWHTTVYTPTVNATPRMIDKELMDIGGEFTTITMRSSRDPRARSDPHASPALVELLIVDEADRLATSALEQLRDHYDRSQLGMILIGMPGIEKRLTRYPQFYSRIGDSAIMKAGYSRDDIANIGINDMSGHSWTAIRSQEQFVIDAYGGLGAGCC